MDATTAYLLTQNIANLNTNHFKGFTAGVSGRPRAGTWATGDTVVDQNGLVCTCVVGGTPGLWKSPGGVYYGKGQLNAAQTIAQGVGPTGFNGGAVLDPYGIFQNSASVNFIFQQIDLGFVHQWWEFHGQILFVNPGAGGSQNIAVNLQIPVGGGGTVYAIGATAGVGNPGFVQAEASTIVEIAGGVATQIQMTITNVDGAHGSVSTQADARASFLTAKLIAAND